MASQNVAISLKGKWIRVPCLAVNGRNIVSHGRFIRTASVHDEGWLEHPVDDPQPYVEALQNERTGKRNKAECLSWLIHLVGDIHQPLHCSSLFGGPFRGKEGDRGGNSFWIRMREDSARPIKLHTLWDGLPGTGKDLDRLAKKAEELVGAHPRRDFPSHTFGTAPVEWSKESRRLSLEKAYQPLPSLDGTQAHPVVVPPDYFKNSKALAEERVTLAGYRLADQIHAQLAAR